MLQKIQGYDYVVEYRSGKSMTLADTLSRLPFQADKTSLDLNLRVDGFDLSKDEIAFCQYDFISFTPKKQYQLHEATKTDPVLNSLMETIVHGWPDNIKAPPVDVRPYWSFTDELAIEDGIIFKGQEVCTRGSPAGCAEATPSISPRPRKDATTGQRMHILAKHLQRH